MFSSTCPITAYALIALLLLTTTPRAAAQNQEARVLELGKPVERELAGEQAHSYLIELAANDLLHVIVEQRGVDVVVTRLTRQTERNSRKWTALTEQRGQSRCC